MEAEIGAFTRDSSLCTALFRLHVNLGEGRVGVDTLAFRVH